LSRYKKGIIDMKKLPAFFASLLITGFVGLVMLGIGGAAFINTNKLPITNSITVTPTVTDVAQPKGTPVQVSGQVDPSQSQMQAQLDAYKAQLDQAIQRINDANTQIQNLQSTLDQTNQQLTDASASLQQYQAVLLQLQQRGLIRIGSDGSVTIRGRSNN